MTTKIELDDFMDFMIRFLQGKFPHQRFGQAFMNDMLSSEADSDIFYEENKKICISKIMEKYISISMWDKKHCRPLSCNHCKFIPGYPEEPFYCTRHKKSLTEIVYKETRYGEKICCDPDLGDKINLNTEKK